MRPRPNRPHRQSRTGNQSIWIFGRHAVLAALANPDRRIERVFVTKEMADTHAAEIGKTAMTITSREDLNQRLPNGSVHQGIAAMVAPLERHRGNCILWWRHPKLRSALDDVCVCNHAPVPGQAPP